MYNQYDKAVLEQEEYPVKLGDPVVESLIVEHIDSMDSEDKKVYLESDAFKALVEIGAISEASVMYLDKGDDLERRISLAATQLEKEQDSALYAQYVKYHEKKQEALAKIVQKNRQKAEKYAKSAQKEFVKATPGAFKKRISIS